MNNSKVLVAIVDYKFGDNADLLKKQLSSNFDVILISSFSDVLPETADVVVENKFYTGLWNEAVRRTISGKYQWLLLIASDIEFKHGIDKLREKIDKVCSRNDVGAYTFSVDSESRCAYPNLIRQTSQEIREIKYIEGFAFMARTSLVESMYPIDTNQNKYGWGLDLAMCELARQSGLKIFVDDSICIHHPESIHKIDTQRAMAEYAQRPEGMLNTIPEVYEYYLKIAKSYANKGLRILKTDAHNESGIWPHSLPLAPALNQGNSLTCVEFSPDVLARAKARYPNLDMRLGDIQTWDGKHDVVLDFSTIDHVQDYSKVLNNYKRIAKEVSIIVWLSDINRQYDDQYLFSETEFKREFFRIFGSGKSRPIFNGQKTKIKSIEHGVLHHFTYSQIQTENQSEPYPWKYLDELNYRYDIVSKLIDFKGKHVVDLCSGNTGLYEIVKPIVKSYRACDKVKLHEIVEQVDDASFVETINQCDILCVFGYGGYEISNNSLESATLSRSILHMVEKFNPLLILECVVKYENAMKRLIPPHGIRKIYTCDQYWLKDRVIYIVPKKGQI